MSCPVAVPNDEGVVVVKRLQCRAQLVGVGRFVCFRIVFVSGIRQMQHERAARVNDNGRPVAIQTVHEGFGEIVPTLQHPAGEYFVAAFGLRGRLCHHFRLVQVEIGVSRGHGAFNAGIAEILHVHTVGIVQLVTPSRIQIQPFLDPETVVLADGVVADDDYGVTVVSAAPDRVVYVSPSVHGVCHRFAFDVFRGDS